MTLIHYAATVKEQRLLELPEEASELHLQPGQVISVQLDPGTPPAPDPALALFDQWEQEDAARLSPQRDVDEQIWQEFEQGLNVTRQAQGMRPL